MLPEALAEPDDDGMVVDARLVSLGTPAEVRGSLRRAMPEVVALAADHGADRLTVAMMLLAYASGAGPVPEAPGVSNPRASPLPRLGRRPRRPVAYSARNI